MTSGRRVGLSYVKYEDSMILNKMVRRMSKMIWIALWVFNLWEDLMSELKLTHNSSISGQNEPIGICTA